MALPTEGLQRRHYVHLIQRAYGKYINPDPTYKMRIGTYGNLDKETGVFVEEGNVYDPEFQKELDKHGVKIKMSDHPPEVGPLESDVVVFSREAKEKDLRVSEADVPGITHAPIKGHWQFSPGKVDAILAMHEPHQIYLPPRVVLEPLYKVDMLMTKTLVTVVHVTDAYTFYLSDKSGGKFSMALLPDPPNSWPFRGTAGEKRGFAWWADAPTGLLRQAIDPTGDSSFMPVYYLMRPIRRVRRRFVGDTGPEPSGDQLWIDEYPPWDPIDDNGEEDEIDPEVFAVDPFAEVDRLHREKMEALAAEEKKAAEEQKAAEEKQSTST